MKGKHCNGAKNNERPPSALLFVLVPVRHMETTPWVVTHPCGTMRKLFCVGRGAH